MKRCRIFTGMYKKNQRDILDWKAFSLKRRTHLMYLTVDWTQHKTDSVSSKTMSKKYPNLLTEGQKNGEKQKHVGQRTKI